MFLRRFLGARWFALGSKPVEGRVTVQRISRWAAAPLAVSLVFGACGGGGDSDGEDDGLSLQDRLFQGNDADFVRQQELIRECMVAQGFEYTPRDNRGNDAVRGFDFDPSSEDFVKEYGFGISTLFGSQIEVRASDEDPNQQYRNTLSEAQKTAYDKALYGQEFGGGGFSVAGGGPIVGIPVGGAPATSGGPGGGDGEAQIFTPGGCVGEAVKETGNDRAVMADLFDDLQELDERVKSDPKMVEAMKKWSTCMSDAGYDYRDLDAAQKELRNEFAEVAGLEVAGDGGGFIVSFPSIGTTGGGDDQSGAQTLDPLANVDKEKLAKLQEKEKRIALASYGCLDEHVIDVEQEVRERFEAEFLEEHPQLKDE